MAGLNQPKPKDSREAFFIFMNPKFYLKFEQTKSSRGFSLIELLVVVAIIATLASIALVAFGGARAKARDVRRKSDLNQIGRFLYASTCYAPNAGAGDYDLAQLIPELSSKYPQLAQYSSMIPRDPRSGSEETTNYRYMFDTDGHCALYANLENESEQVTLPSITQPTPGAGTGVFTGTNEGANGTRLYFQIGR
jgi:prepilin-type N-terminal cleavage/methylation domain-containing protein